MKQTFSILLVLTIVTCVALFFVFTSCAFRLVDLLIGIAGSCIVSWVMIFIQYTSEKQHHNDLLIVMHNRIRDVLELYPSQEDYVKKQLNSIHKELENMRANYIVNNDSNCLIGYLASCIQQNCNSKSINSLKSYLNHLL